MSPTSFRNWSISREASFSIRSGRPARSAAGTVVVGLGAGLTPPPGPPGCMSRRTVPRDWLQHHPRSKTLRTRLQQVGLFGARARKTRHKNWRVPLRRFAGCLTCRVAPGCSSPECDTTRAVAHHTGSGVVVFLGGGVYAYRVFTGIPARSRVAREPWFPGSHRTVRDGLPSYGSCRSGVTTRDPVQ